MVVVDTPMNDAFFITAFSGGLDRSVSCINFCVLMNCIIHNSFLKNCNCKFQAAQLGVNFCEFTALTCGGGCPSSERTLPAEALRLAQGVNVKMNVVLETATGVASAFQPESSKKNAPTVFPFPTKTPWLIHHLFYGRSTQFRGHIPSIL